MQILITCGVRDARRKQIVFARVHFPPDFCGSVVVRVSSVFHHPLHSVSEVDLCLWC